MNKIQAHSSMHNEGGEGFNPEIAKSVATAAAKAEARMADLIARAAEIKAVWNAAVAAHTKNGQVPATAIKSIEAAAGVTVNEIKTLKALGAF